MALYTNKSYDDIAADYDAWQRQEKQRQEKLAQEAYTRSQYQAQKKNDNPGGLAGVLSGIVNSVANVGKGIGDLATRGAISLYGATGLKSLLEGKDYLTANAEAQRDQEDFIKRYYNTDSTKDAYNKAAGTALDAAMTVSDFIPVAGAAVKAGTAGAKGANFAAKVAKAATNPAAKVALNIGQGAVSGAAQNYINNGENATLEDTLKGALIGAAGAGAGQAVGGKLASKMPSDSLTSKLLYGSVGKGALTGAASGAVSGGVGSALYGGNVFEGATKGAGQGAVGGATTGAVTGLIGTAANKVKTAREAKKAGAQTTTAEAELPPATVKRQTPTGWDGEEIDGSKRNGLQKFAKALRETGNATENNDIYGRLNNNTARDVQKRGTIKTLKDKYGYTSSDYDKAANTSTAVNHFVAQEAEMSGASGHDVGLVERIAVDPVDTPDMKESTRKSYRAKSQQLLQNALVDGGGMDEYSVSGLYKAAEEAGDLANQFYEKSHNKMDGTVTNPDLNALSKAYGKFKNEVRTVADNMLGGEIDDTTRNNLTAMLKNAGAPKEAVQTLSSAKNFRELIRLTSPLEEARKMNEQMIQTQYKRGATTDSTRANVLNETLRATGAPQLAKAVAAPAGQLVGKAEQIAANGIEYLGNAAAGKVNTIPGRAIAAAASVPRAINNNSLLGDNSIMTRQIARQTALDQAEAAQARAYNNAAEEEAQAIRKQGDADYAQAIANIRQIPNAATTAQTANAEKQLNTIRTAMELALNAGDFTAYGQLANIYNDAYKIYSAQQEAIQTASNPYANLSSSQIENINKLENAGNAIDELEQLFTKAGGGQGFIGGNAANFMASLGLNSDVATYNSIARGLVNQISAAIGKTDSLNTEGEVQRALELIPQMTDDAQTAKNKLEQLRQMLESTKASTYKSYGVTQ